MDFVEKMKEYIWIFDTIVQRESISLSDLNAEWMKTEMSLNEPMSRRTFMRRRRDLEELFGVDIRVNARNEYYVEDRKEWQCKGFRNMLMSNMREAYFIQKFRRLGNRIQLPDVARGNEFLEMIGDAISGSRLLTMTYQKYTDSEPYSVDIEPYCMRLFEKRWFVVARKVTEDVIKVFSLDRIVEMEATDKEFIPVQDFDPDRYFRDYYGIYVSPKNAVEEVVVRSTPIQAKYLRALPLHHSQREVGEGEFHYNLIITPDFVNELLRIGECMEVIAPASLREEIINRLRGMLERYK